MSSEKNGTEEVPSTTAAVAQAASGVSGKLQAKAKKAGKTVKAATEKTISKDTAVQLAAFEYDYPTIEGEKKNISGAWPKAYNPSVIEANWYSWWEKKGFFKANPKSERKGTFSMMIPPPNVTGALHIGHALTNSIQDSLTRWNKMIGNETLWLPGVDHAGIATQVAVEKLLAHEKKTRWDVGREEFLRRTWEWKEQYGGRICRQLRRLGSALDWSREVFTMDEARTRVHNRAFVRLFEKGRIYRDNRLVNWDCTLGTAVSDVEVEYTAVDSPVQWTVPGHPQGKKYPFGYLWVFDYPIVPIDAIGEASEVMPRDVEELAKLEKLTIATTRPETILGDTAVAIHPDDERYKHLHGRRIYHPFAKRSMPIICDSVLVDKDFGTGAVKITPAHDPNDFECGKRHNLEFINILNDNGTMHANSGEEFSGMPRMEARLKVITDLTKLGLYKGKEPNQMSIGRSQRSSDVIEPLLKPQWWVDCRDMARRALEAVDNHELLIVPENPHIATWHSYLGNIRPWCVSRQLWWGHRIPMYKVWLARDVVGVDNEVIAKAQEKPDGSMMSHWIAAENKEQAEERALKHVRDALNLSEEIALEHIGIEQDEDVSDTWFSSGLFPFSTLDENQDDLKRFYPGSVLETGHDIIFFWVARMVMLSLELNDCLPFKEVYLHAMVRDAHGEKMSKSKGNVVDPIHVIEGVSLETLQEAIRNNNNISEEEKKLGLDCQRADFPAGIAECGTDALRFCLCANTSQGRNVNLDISKVVAYRNFCNKLFNATKFGCTFAGITASENGEIDIHFADETLSKYDDFADFIRKEYDFCELREKWILSRLQSCVKTVNEAMRTYRIADAVNAINDFWYADFCDVYLELVKPVISSFNDVPPKSETADRVRMVFYSCLDQGLKLIHPFMPFISEELWQHLPHWNSDAEHTSIMLTDYPVCTKRPYIWGSTAEYSLDDNFYASLAEDERTVYTPSFTKLHCDKSELVMEIMKPILSAARLLRNQYQIANSKTPNFKVAVPTSAITGDDAAVKEYVENVTKALPYFQVLISSKLVELIDIAPEAKPKGHGVAIVSANCIVYMDLNGMVNFETEIAKLKKEIEQNQTFYERSQAKMENPNFERMPEKVRQGIITQATEYQTKINHATELLEEYTKMLDN